MGMAHMQKLGQTSPSCLGLEALEMNDNGEDSHHGFKTLARLAIHQGSAPDIGYTKIDLSKPLYHKNRTTKNMPWVVELSQSTAPDAPVRIGAPRFFTELGDNRQDENRPELSETTIQT